MITGMGTVKTPATSWNIDPDSTDPFVIEITAASCNYKLCTGNDITVVEPEARTENSALSQTLTRGKQADEKLVA